MKRFWLVMLSLGLVLAFSASAMAVDVKFSGSFDAAGMYLDKVSVAKGNGSGGTAFYFQTLKINTDFIVSPGLKLVTSFTALDRVWGGMRSNVDAPDSRSLGTRAEAENIAMNLAYVSYASPIGLFEVGFIHDNVWGTTFGDNDKNGFATGGIEWILPIGHGAIGAVIYKEADGSSYYNNPSPYMDADNDKYILFGMYNFTKNIEGGVLGSWSRVATFKPTAISPFPTGINISLFTIQPYVKAKIGPVAVEAEVWYGFGNAKWEDGGFGLPDQTLSQWMAYVNAVADFGMFYVGGTFAYVSGDNNGTQDKMEGGLLGGGADFNPCLIMFNNDLTYWAGAISGFTGTAMQSQLYSTATNSGMQNALFGQLKAGVRPVAKLDIAGSISYAVADQKYNGTVVGLGQHAPGISPVNDGSYGLEIDLTATYKITNNLSYMLGGAYWFVGDFFKGTTTSDLNNEYLLINKLTLTF
jgi:hypothetical protein